MQLPFNAPGGLPTNLRTALLCETPAIDSGDSSISVPAIPSSSPATKCHCQRLEEAAGHQERKVVVILPPKAWDIILALLHGKGKDKCKEDVDAMSPFSVKKAVAFALDAHYTEGLLGENKREWVPDEEIAPGSGLRAVVKIKVWFSGGKDYSGTGFVINEHIIATAGHLVFDASGHAKKIAIFAGVGGNPVNVESRVGTHAVVPWPYFSKFSGPNDVALVYFDEPFGSLSPMMTRQTPFKCNGTLIGFAGDVLGGMKLCRSSSTVTFKNGEAEHKADSNDGTSGAPLLDESGVAIAVHTGGIYKNEKVTINTAAPIDWEGNDFAHLVEVLAYMDRRSKGIEVIETITNEKSTPKVEMLGKVNESEGLAFTW